MEIFDTHFHYYGESSPVEFCREMLAEAAAPPQGDILVPDTIRLMAVGGDFLESRRAAEFAQVIDAANFAVGVHPHQAAAFLAEEAADFGEFRNHPKLSAVGELGLDYYYEQSERGVQKTVFGRFLELASEWGLPAIVHIRDKDGCDDAYRDAFDLLKPFAAAGGAFVVHCFSGTPQWAERFLELGGYCGMTGMVTFGRAGNIRETLRVIPDGRLLIETDSPYLAPVPHRGRRNHPGYLVLIADRIARERGRAVEEIIELTTANGRRFFRI